MNKHTKGPWKVSHHMNAEHLVYPEVGRTPICLIAGMFSTKTKNANVRLIAAAPELLEALLELLNSCVLADVHEELSGIVTGETMDKARAAIAKARGLEASDD